MTIHQFIPPGTFERLSMPTGEGGTCLPNACCTDPGWLALENEGLFARSWMYAGSVDHVAEPGDVFPTTTGHAAPIRRA